MDADWAILRKKLAYLEGFADAIDSKPLKTFTRDTREVVKRLHNAASRGVGQAPVPPSQSK